MTQKISEICLILEDFAPIIYQESYDNCGLIVGNKDNNVSNILLCIDVTEAVVEEAIAHNCNLIIAHHPLIFKSIKKLTGSDYVQKTIIKAIKNDISIYACHTNLDNIIEGVSYKMASKLGLKDIEILAPKSNLLYNLTVFVPKENTEKLLDSLHEAGAGNIGNYKNCSFTSDGVGQFLPGKQSNPHTGTVGYLEKVNENKVEVVFPIDIKEKVLMAMKKNHPYEVIAYNLSLIQNLFQQVGSGVIANLEKEISGEELIQMVKKVFGIKVLKHTQFHQSKIKKIALCGGSGSFLLNQAISQKADVFISSDFKYHEYFDAENKITILDIGHYESEQFTTEIFYEVLSKKISNIAIRFSETNTNPVIHHT